MGFYQQSDVIYEAEWAYVRYVSKHYTDEPELAGKYCVCHLNDAFVEGPFDTEEAAIKRCDIIRDESDEEQD